MLTHCPKGSLVALHRGPLWKRAMPRALGKSHHLPVPSFLICEMGIMRDCIIGFPQGGKDIVHIQRWAHNKYSVKLAFFFLSKAVDYLVSSLAEVLVLISFRVFLSFFLKYFVYLSTAVSFEDFFSPF